MIASLPWYDFSELQPVNDRFWSRLAHWCRVEGFEDVPEQLDRVTGYEEQWIHGELLLSQACGYDVVMPHKETLQIVASPCYAAEGCEGALYSSFVVVRADSPARALAELRGKRCVINTPTSHSGMNVLRAMIAPLHEEGRFFESVGVSGSHRASLARIRRGRADVAAIDCVTYALIERHRPQVLEGTRVLCGTPRVPAPPFVTSARRSAEDVRRLQGALARTLVDPLAEAALEDLMLEGVELPHEAYWVIEDLEQIARRNGYREIESRFDLEQEEEQG